MYPLLTRIFDENQMGRVACHDLLDEVKQVSDDWMAKVQSCERISQNLKSWCSMRWMMYPHVAEVLNDYTKHGDTIINGFLRQNKVPSEVIYACTFDKAAENKSTEITPSDDEYLQELRLAIIRGEDTRNILPRGYQPILKKCNDDKIRQSIQLLDSYFERGASRLPEEIFVFRKADSLREGKQLGYTSTTYDISLFDKFGPFANFGTIESLDEPQREEIQAKMEALNNIKRLTLEEFNEFEELLCCVFVIRVPANTPFVAISPLSQADDESELLFPRNMRITVRNMAICKGRSRETKLWWFVDVSYD